MWLAHVDFVGHIIIDRYAWGAERWGYRVSYYIVVFCGERGRQAV